MVRMTDFYMKLKLDRRSSVPMYYQLKTFIIDSITNGVLTEGEMLPPEQSLSRYFGVSRPTIRQALNELTQEGYLIRRRPVGTFVKERQIVSDRINEIVPFKKEMGRLGIAYQTKLLFLAPVTCDGNVQRELKLADRQTVLLERLRMIKNTSLLVEYTYLPYAIGRPLLNVDLEKESMYESLREKAGIVPGHARRIISSLAADDRIATALGVEKGFPILRVITITASMEDVPFEYSDAYIRSDRYTMELESFSFEYEKTHAERR